MHRWASPLAELSTMIDTQQRQRTITKAPSQLTEDYKRYLNNRWTAHVQNFAPVLFRAIQCLQAFCNPANAAAMPYGLQGIGPTVDTSGWDEAAGNVTLEHSSNIKTVQSLLRRLQKNIRRARYTVYYPVLLD
jgi:hypothetical protein